MLGIRRALAFLLLAGGLAAVFVTAARAPHRSGWTGYAPLGSAGHTIGASSSHRYSVRQVRRAFAAQGIELRDVLPKDFRGLLALLAEPSHAVYVYVVQKGCKCAFLPPIRNGRKTRHGNLDVLWLRRETPAVRAALRVLQ